MGEETNARGQGLGPWDVYAIVVGLVIGAGIFKAPALVAANVTGEGALLTAWLLGGAASVVGALCYAELAAAYPDRGGEYHFLRRAFGERVGFLFAWARLAVLQTGSIALLAYVLGDYLAELISPAAHAQAIYAAAAVTLLTALNLLGLRPSRLAQNAMTVLLLAGLLFVIASGLSADAVAAPAAHSAPAAAGGGTATFGLAMVFVLLTYGGWNEAAYLSAELRGARSRRMALVLIASLATVTLLYLLMNLSYLRVLGIEAMSSSPVVTADLMRLLFGEAGARAVTLLIVIAVAASINVTILTGARSTHALAGSHPLFAPLGRWSAHRQAPVAALLVQGAVALLLVLAGSLSRSGFEAMVMYVSPVFWLFFLLTTLTLFVLRRRDPGIARPFRVPGYPLTPLLFAGVCLYMLYASVIYAGWGALLGVALLLAGLILLESRGAHRPRPAADSEP